MDWQEEAWDWALDRFEVVKDSFSTKEFIEFIGSIGGDVLTYRYYANGTITER